jgi:RNA polymerase sigma factor (sigma-70 family)
MRTSMTTTIDERYIGQIQSEIFDLHERDQRIEFARLKWEKYISNVASKFRNSVSGYDDFLQEANFLIIKAADAWNPTRSEARFETYAYTCIRNGLIDFSTRTKGAVSIPSGSLKLDESNVKTVRLNDEIEDQRNDVFAYADIIDTIESFDHVRIGIMYFVEKRTLEEIAELVGESRSTVHRRVQDMKTLIRSKV